MLAEQYLTHVRNMLERIQTTQLPAIEKAGTLIAESLMHDGMLHVFGSGHAGMLAQELCYRAGGLIPVNPIYGPGMMAWDWPMTRATRIEQTLEKYGAILVESAHVGKGDVFLTASPAGRIPVVVEAALEAKRLGATVIAITSLDFTRRVSSFHSSGKRLFEVADLVIDDCGAFGDAVLEVPEHGIRTVPASTVAMAAIANGIVARVVEIYVERGQRPPVFVSSNVDGGVEENARLLERYGKRIRYTW